MDVVDFRTEISFLLEDFPFLDGNRFQKRGLGGERNAEEFRK